ncbi:hypothetical protein EDB19DRAFT_1199215 [Suillus lakei]|nr:hypothetical protein EDB19DRAFT_1199215 [Suillus lakei]
MSYNQPASRPFYRKFLQPLDRKNTFPGPSVRKNESCDALDFSATSTLPANYSPSAQAVTERHSYIDAQEHSQPTPETPMIPSSATGPIKVIASLREWFSRRRKLEGEDVDLVSDFDTPRPSVVHGTSAWNKSFRYERERIRRPHFREEEDDLVPDFDTPCPSVSHGTTSIWKKNYRVERERIRGRPLRKDSEEDNLEPY